MSERQYCLASAARGDRVAVGEHSGRLRNGQVICTSDSMPVTLLTL
jgi:hypothetical protein